MSSRTILSKAMLDSMLKSKGIRIPKKPCCGRPAAPIKYERYLGQLGYHGKFAISNNGVVTELCDVP